MRTTLLLTLVSVSLSMPVAAQTATPSRNRAHWISLKTAGFAVPEGRRAGDLLVEMNRLLASPDPVLRDEVAYSAAERWIVRERRLGANELRAVRDLWLTNLADGLGASGDDRAFKRSFSALCLSLVAAADVATPFMTQEEFDEFLDRILDYFAKERDLRGYDARRGWIHTVAHTADVLKFLARNPKLQPGDAERIAAAVAAKLRAAGDVFQWGEPDRLALALLPVVRKQPALVEGWLRPWPDEVKRLWAGGPQVDPKQFALVQNVTHVLQSLYVILQLAMTQPGGSSHDEAASAKAVLATLNAMR